MSIFMNDFKLDDDFNQKLEEGFDGVNDYDDSDG